ncbi:pentatricopeptide repeat-containing protein At4g19220, mitochondrial isoform X2 [Phoenix dactylifera]|uniref:Pentatricopeptide repeat-containing protein At4g19220, mitochondrial isoform X2 n=1 Tax=Phoenix dactylifera TaxID=42345 RepID=A0A8B9ABH5_PHODC|nr:pentatricopeptide repeat-containing protein At4g19220, mitochondrial isoform X2 [Phoenix dactylifera]
MARNLRGFGFKSLLVSKSIIPLATPRHVHFSPQGFIERSLSHPLLTYSSLDHHLSDEMPQRAAFVFHILKLLKPRTSLLTAYARAHDLDSSMALFDEAVARDVIIWNAIINAFVLNCHFQTSIVLFQEMTKCFGKYDSTTLVIMMSAFSRTHNLRHGTALHGMIIKRCFDFDVYLCNALIDMYAKCGDWNSSELVFGVMEAKDAASWNSMINGSLYNSLPVKSVFCFREMSRSFVREDEVSLSGVISACSYLEELFAFGESVHGWVIKLGYQGIPLSSVSNSLISFYSRHGDVETAELIFKRLVDRNVVSWNSMISGLVENGRFDRALDFFWEMQKTSAMQTDGVTVVTIIPVCGEFNLLRQGKSIHGFTIRRELDPMDCSIENSLLDMYLKCDDVATANLLFRTMPNRDLISWNTMISGYARIISLKREARVLFSELLQTDLKCSLTTLLAILPACTCPNDLSFGKAVHCWMLKFGFANCVLAVNALMLMYINCGELTASSMLLKSILSVSDVISWNTIIVGYVQNGCYKEALEAFEFMCCSLLLNPDSITLVSALSACGHLELLLHGCFIHAFALKSSMDCDVRVRNALITMYFRCQDIMSAESVFQMDGDRNLCSWTCMISGYVQNKEGGRALEIFRHMEDFVPNEISIVGILCACTQLGNLRLGKEINGHVFRFELQTNAFISSALLDMYSKCGRLNTAFRVFETSAEKSISCWNSMISAYGFHGHGRIAIELFLKMCELGVKATESTFIALLSACSHSGLVDEGWKFYNLMSEKFGIKPTVEHHVCMVDMLGRARRLGEAYEFVMKMPVKPEPGVWGALLSACNDPADLKLGKSIGEHLFASEPENAGYYVTVSNLYAYYGLWSDAVNIRSMIRDRGLVKPPGCSAINVLSG